MAEVQTVAADGDILGECPIWSEAEQALYRVDIRGPAVHRIRSGETPAQWPMPSPVGSIALRSQGGLLVALQTGLHAFDPSSRSLERLGSAEPEPGNRFNDGRCDRAGRFWVGTMLDGQKQPTGSLYRIDGSFSCKKMLGDIFTPNSLCWSPDNKTMYFADTHRRQIMAYEFDITDGVISAPRVFADLTDAPGRPDGSAVDAEGCVWNAEYGGGRIVRYTPRGNIDRVIEMPVSQPTCCCFGGAKLDTLFITSARQKLTPDQLAREPLAGGVFAVDVGVRGLPEAAFAG